VNFSVDKNDKPDEQPSGGFKESRNHIIRQAANLLQRRAIRRMAARKDTHRYNPPAPKPTKATVPKHAKTCRYP
jgi:hypothetical protein